MGKLEISPEVNRAIEQQVLKSIKTIAEDLCEQTAKRYFNDYLGNKINMEIEKHLTSNLESQMLLILKEHKLVSESNHELNVQSIKKFLDSIDNDYQLIVGEPTNTVYDEYYEFCSENKLPKLDKQWFSRELKRQTGIHTRVTTVNRKSVRIYTMGESNE